MTIKPGDRVQIIQPQRIYKIGYEKDLEYYLSGVLINTSREIKDFCISLKIDDLCVHDITFAVAKALERRERREGTERKIFYVPFTPTLRSYTVKRTFKRQTGKYSQGFYDPNTNLYYPPSLTNIKVHTILQLTGNKNNPVDYAKELYVTSEQVIKESS